MIILNSHGRCGTSIRGNASYPMLMKGLALEQISVSATVSGRHSSVGELEYLGGLKAKYGVDFEAMARDRKLNYDQRTGGALRRAFRKSGLERV